MSILRDFSELFLFHRREMSFLKSLYTRVSIPIAIMIESFTSLTLMHGLCILFTVYSYLLLLFMLHLLRGLRRALNALKIPMIFLGLGYTVTLLSIALGYPAPSLTQLTVSSAKIGLIFLSIATLTQVVSLRELRWIMSRLGLGKLASFMAIVFSFIPLLLNLYSEAIWQQF